MNVFFRLFAALDVIAGILLSMELWYRLQHFNELSARLSVKVQSILMVPMWILLCCGVIAHLLQKKTAFICYYIQFPFRLYLWIFSIGFITLLPEALGYFEDIWFEVLLKGCFMFEFIRLYLSIRFHRKLLRQRGLPD